MRETAVLRHCGIALPAVGFWVVVDGSVLHTAGTGSWLSAGGGRRLLRALQALASVVKFIRAA